MLLSFTCSYAFCACAEAVLKFKEKIHAVTDITIAAAVNAFLFVSALLSRLFAIFCFKLNGIICCSVSFSFVSMLNSAISCQNKRSIAASEKSKSITE